MMTDVAARQLAEAITQARHRAIVAELHEERGFVLLHKGLLRLAELALAAEARAERALVGAPGAPHALAKPARGPRIGRGLPTMVSGREPIVGEVVIANVPLDPLMSLKAVAAYADVSLRTVRGFVELPPDEALPCYRLPGKVLVKRSEFDRWFEQYRSRGRPSLTQALRSLGLVPQST